MAPRLLTFAATALLTLASCSARPDAQPNIAVTDAWARATVTGQSGSAAYMTIGNTGDGSDRLLSAGSPGAAASLHSSSSEGGVMRMRALPDGLEIPAGAKVNLQPGGAHIMLTGLSAPLATGSQFPLTLKFERSGQRKISVRVVDPSAAGMAMNGMEGM